MTDRPDTPPNPHPHRRFIPADMAPNDAYIEGHKDRYKRDREADILCVHCGKPWAIPAERP